VALEDDLLERSDAHGGPAEFFDLGSVLLGLLLGGAEPLLHGDKLIHEEVVLDMLDLKRMRHLESGKTRWRHAVASALGGAGRDWSGRGTE